MSHFETRVNKIKVDIQYIVYYLGNKEKYMKNFLYFLLFMFSFNALADKLIKVAVIDTGIDPEYIKYTPLCETGHRDFSGEGLNDLHGHGTNVIGLIVNNANSKNYCIIVIKAYAMRFFQKHYLTEALEYAHSLNVHIINFSSGGIDPLPKERRIIMKLLDEKVAMFVAAGNNKSNLNVNCNYYPACYDSRLFVIGSSRATSNYGDIVDAVFDGDNQEAFGRKLSGTSMATAIATGKLLKEIDLKRKER